MQARWITWLLALMLFGAGAVWGQLFFNKALILFTGFDIELVTSLATVCAAIATAFAASAASRSATMSSRQSNELSVQNRMQRHIFHQSQFQSMLLEIEKQFKVSFVGGVEFYNELFPYNRYIDKDFSFLADEAVLKGILDGYRSLNNQRKFLLKTSCVDSAVLNWAILVSRYANSKLWLEFGVSGGSQITYSADDGAGTLGTGMNELNCKDFFYIVHNVAYRLINFSSPDISFPDYKWMEDWDNRLLAAIKAQKQN